MKALTRGERQCAKCTKLFGPEHVGHNVTWSTWYCSELCYSGTSDGSWGGELMSRAPSKKVRKRKGATK